MDVVPAEGLDSVLRQLLKSRGTHQIVFVRTLDILKARRRPHLKKCMEEAALVLPVSRGIQTAARKLGYGTVPRYFPFNVAIRTLNQLEEIHGGLYILGDKADSNQIVEKNLKQTFPGMRVVGRYVGKYPRQMHGNIMTAIAKASPNLLLCGSGLKGMDMWIHRRRARFPVGVQIWSGECFDYFASRRKRPGTVTFRNGHEYLAESWGRPWRVLRFPLHVWFRFLVLMSRVFC